MSLHKENKLRERNCEHLAAHDWLYADGVYDSLHGNAAVNDGEEYD